MKNFITSLKSTRKSAMLLSIVALFSACSSMPRSTSLLDQARSDYQMAQSNSNVTSYAPLELKQAGDALEQANVAAIKNERDEKIDQLAYIAKQKIALTQEVAKQKSAEASIAAAGKQRDQIRLDQRTDEADRAKLNAAQARADTAEAQRDTLEAQAHAAQLEAQLADLAAKKTERGMVITLGDVLFGTDLARLNPEGMRTAQKLADVLQQNPQRKVLVEGFTDSTGTTPHNQELSERRATAVSSALQQMGVTRDRIAMRGYGETFPAAANDTASNRQLNRRVEIVLSDASGNIVQR